MERTMSPIQPVGTLGFFGLPGHLEMIIILVILLLLFGRRLPEVARSLGDGIREFKKGVQDVTADVSPNSTNNSNNNFNAQGGNQPAQFTQGLPSQGQQQQPAPQPVQEAPSGSYAQPPAGGEQRRVSQDPHPGTATGGSGGGSAAGGGTNG